MRKLTNIVDGAGGVKTSYTPSDREMNAFDGLPRPIQQAFRTAPVNIGALSFINEIAAGIQAGRIPPDLTPQILARSVALHAEKIVRESASYGDTPDARALLSAALRPEPTHQDRNRGARLRESARIRRALRHLPEHWSVPTFLDESGSS